MATEEKDQFYIELCEKAGVIKRKLKPTTKHLGQAILINFINAIFYDVTEPIFDVQGDSMFPEYLEGDVVIVLLCSDFDNGDDCVVFIDGYDATLKRCYRTDKGIQLKPLNQAYPPKTYGEGDEPIEILGIVKEIRRKVK